MVNTPLRYPGGKSVLSTFLKSIIGLNYGPVPIYAEPYAGGAGAGINLLLSGSVSEIYINDANKAIYSFWYSLKHYGSDFLHLFDNTEISLDQWQIQRQVFKMGIEDPNPMDTLLYGFSTFYLNRCNRSGILHAGPIGGQSDESQTSATDKINARFNKNALREKLVTIIKVSDQIKVYNDDALVFLRKRIGRMSTKKQNRFIVYLDPPYYQQGANLYMNYYNIKDHLKLAKYLLKGPQYKWLLSYDNTPEIRALYPAIDIFTYKLSYTAQEKKIGSELLIPSPNLILPSPLEITRSTSNIPINSIDKLVT
jgi:DNA adenine methylase